MAAAQLPARTGPSLLGWPLPRRSYQQSSALLRRCLSKLCASFFGRSLRNDNKIQGTIKFALSKCYCRGASHQKKNSVLGDLPLCPQSKPQILFLLSSRRLRFGEVLQGVGVFNGVCQVGRHRFPFTGLQFSRWKRLICCTKTGSGELPE